MTRGTFYFVRQFGTANVIRSTHRKLEPALKAAKALAKKKGVETFVEKSIMIARFLKTGRRIPV